MSTAKAGARCTESRTRGFWSIILSQYLVHNGFAEWLDNETLQSYTNRVGHPSHGVVWGGGQVPARWAICTQTAIFLCSSKQRPVVRRGSIPPSERINWLNSRTSWGSKRGQDHQCCSYFNCCHSEVLCWSSRCAQNSVQSRTRITSYTFGCSLTASDFCLPSLPASLAQLGHLDGLTFPLTSLV